MVSPKHDRPPQFKRSVRNRPAMRRRSELAVFLQLSLVSLGIASGGVLGWLGNEYIQGNQTFRLRQVRVADVPQHLQVAVETVLRPALGSNLLTMDLEWVHRQVQSIPAVQTTTIRRVLPNAVNVSVQARKAFVMLESPAWTRAVSRDGVVLGAARDAAHLPWVRVVAPVDVGNDRRLPDPLARQFAETAVLLEWLLQTDRALYRRLDAKLASMVSILKHELPRPGSLIDLRYEAMVVVTDAGSNDGSQE